MGRTWKSALPYADGRADFHVRPDRLKPMRTLIRFVLSSLLLASSCATRAAETSQTLRKDVQNHNERIRSLLETKEYAKVQKETERLRDDLKALAGHGSELGEWRMKKVAVATQESLNLITNLRQSAADTDPVAAKASYKKLQLPLRTIERAFAAPSDPGETAGPDQLRKDILNHNRQLENFVRSQKFDGVNDEVEELENDLDALVEQIKTEMEAIKTQAEDLQRQARQGKGGDADAAYKNLQRAINASWALRVSTQDSGGGNKP